MLLIGDLLLCQHYAEVFLHISIMTKSGECSVAWNTSLPEVSLFCAHQILNIFLSMRRNTMTAGKKKHEKSRNGNEHHAFFQAALCSDHLIPFCQAESCKQTWCLSFCLILWNVLLLQSGPLQCKLTQPHTEDDYLMQLFCTCSLGPNCETKTPYNLFSYQPPLWSSFFSPFFTRFYTF